MLMVKSHQVSTITGTIKYPRKPFGHRAGEGHNIKFSYSVVENQRESCMGGRWRRKQWFFVRFFFFCYSLKLYARSDIYFFIIIITAMRIEYSNDKLYKQDVDNYNKNSVNVLCTYVRFRVAFTTFSKNYSS